MVADKNKKAKIEEKVEEEQIDGRLVLSVEMLQEIQDDLEKLPIDVSVLDAIVADFFVTGSKKERAAADQILQANPDMWLQVVHIVQNTKSMDTKFFALQVLEGVMKNLLGQT